MKIVILIEQDSNVSDTLVQILRSLDPTYFFIKLKDVEEFSLWLEKLIANLTNRRVNPNQSPTVPEENPAPPHWGQTELAGGSIVDLVICDAQNANSEFISMFERVGALFTKYHLSPEGKKVPLIFTSYKSPQFDISIFFPPSVSNLLIKPLDTFVAKETLRLALASTGPLTADIYSQQDQGTLEMVKTVHILKFTELGFRTLAHQRIPLGKKARYYDSFFDISKSVFAYCYNCEPSTKEKDSYECSFSFFGIAPDQFKAIRRKVKDQPQRERLVLESRPSASKPPHRILVLTSDHQIWESIRKLLQEQFVELEMLPMMSYQRLLESIPPQKIKALGQTSPYRGLFLDEKNIILVMNNDFSEVLAVTSNDGVPMSPDSFLGEIPLKSILGSNQYFEKLMSKEDQDRWHKCLKSFDANLLQIFPIHTNEDDVAFLQVTNVRKVESQNESLENQAEVRNGLAATFNTGPEVNNNIQLKSQNVTEELNLVTYEVRLTDLQGDERFTQLKNLMPKMDTLDAIFIDQTNLDKFSLEIIKQVLPILGLQSCRLFGLSQNPVENYLDLEKTDFLDDVFCLPIDLFYFSRKMKQFCPHWKTLGGNPLTRDSINTQRIIKTGMPIDVHSLSEVHLSFKYHRAIPVGEIREFALFGPRYTDAPEILGKCHFSEKQPGTDEYINHFLFFALEDQHLRSLRRLLKETYVLGR